MAAGHILVVDLPRNFLRTCQSKVLLQYYIQTDDGVPGSHSYNAAN